MTVRDFTSKCKNSLMCVDVRFRDTGENVRDTTRVMDYVTAENPDKNCRENSRAYEFYKSLHEVLELEVKEFEYSFDLCMGEGFVLYV